MIETNKTLDSDYPFLSEAKLTQITVSCEEKTLETEQAINQIDTWLSNLKMSMRKLKKQAVAQTYAVTLCVSKVNKKYMATLGTLEKFHFKVPRYESSGAVIIYF